MTVLLVVVAVLLGGALTVRALRALREGWPPPLNGDEDPERRVREQFRRRRQDLARRAVDEARARESKREG